MSLVSACFWENNIIPCRFGLLPGTGALWFQCLPQFANASSIVDLGYSLTMKARTVTISSGHAVPFNPTRRKRNVREDPSWKYSTATEEDSPGMNRRKTE